MPHILTWQSWTLYWTALTWRSSSGLKSCMCGLSPYVYHWMSDTLISKARLHTKAVSEMLIRRRLSTIKKLVDEYELSVDVTLVTSNSNFVDRLTRVPQKWYYSIKRASRLYHQYALFLWRRDNENTSQQASRCKKDVLFHVAEQSTSVYKCSKCCSQRGTRCTS